MFCLFAAETWRRKHDGGPWKWETVFNEINEMTLNYSQIYDWLQNGLAYWERTILQSLTQCH
jgi:hypothetical protein